MDRPDRLLGYLASARSDLFGAGEVLMTNGLACVLRDVGASEAVSALCGVGAGLEWVAEQPASEDRRRIDLVGWRSEGNARWPAVAVEAKIRARLDPGQLVSYRAWLDQECAAVERAGTAVVLVPKWRQAEATEFAEELAMGGCDLRVITWEGLLSQLSEAGLGQGPRCDLEQLSDLYGLLSGGVVSPFSEAELGDSAWRGRRDDLLTLAYQASAALHRSYCAVSGERSRMPPWFDGRYRYVQVDPSGTCVAVGLFDAELEGWPLAARYHHETEGFEAVKARLKSSPHCVEPGRARGSEAHAFVRLELRPQTGYWEMLEDLDEQLRAVVAAGGSTRLPRAYPED